MPGAKTPVTAETFPGYYNVRSNVQPWRNQQSLGGQLKISYDFASARFVSMTGYRKVKQDFNLDQEGSSFALVDAFLFSDTKGFTQEFQVQSLEASRIKWIAGVFYLKADAHSDPLFLRGAAFPVASTGGSTSRDGRIKTDSIAGYTQATFPVGATSDLTAGVRYTHDKKDLIFVETFGNGFTRSRPNGATWNAVTWRVALSHKFTEDLMGYVSASRGYKSGEFGIYTFGNPVVQPEYLNAVELGVKSEFAERRVRANVALFNYKYKNIQLNQIIVGGQFLLNAAAATIKGIDVDLQALVTPNFTIGAGVSHLFDHAYDNFPNAPGTIRNARGTNTTITIPNAAGNTMIQSPDTTANVNFGYHIPLARGSMQLSAAYAYNSGFFWEADNRVKESAFGLLNAQVAWSSPGDKFQVRLWGKNLADEQYAYYLNAAIEDVQSPAPPRTYGVAFDFKF